MLSLRLIERSDPPSINSEESTKLLVEIGLLDVGARKWRHPEFLRISLQENEYDDLLTVVYVLMNPVKPMTIRTTPIKIAVKGLLADHKPHLKNAFAMKPILAQYYLKNY